jgi:DNA invertase Pin-like site-specific DNA recombinase
MTNTEKRAWVYTRIDAPEDTHGMLKNQEKELLSYAEQMGFSIAGISSDLGSGTDFKRPGLARLTDAAAEGSFNILLVKSVSRLGRDAVKTTELLRQLNGLGITVFSPLEGEINLDAALWGRIRMGME